MVDYAALADKAKATVERYGRTVTLIRLSRTLDDPAKPWRGTTDPRTTPDSSVSASAVFVTPSGGGLGKDVVSEELIKRSTQIAIVALGSESTDDLTTFDEMVDGTRRWKVTGVEELSPGLTSLLYYVGVKR